MSIKPHPLRQTQTFDYSVLRQPSNASSSASSGYSSASGTYEFSRTSTLSSSPTSLYSNQGKGHRRGQSEVSRIVSTLSSFEGFNAKPMSDNNNNNSNKNTISGSINTGSNNNNNINTNTSTSTSINTNIYNVARQSLRPLPQVPSDPPTTPPKATKSPHAFRHERGKSLDISRLSIAENERPSSSPLSKSTITTMTTGRPSSVALTRSDTVAFRGSEAVPHALPHSPSHSPAHSPGHGHGDAHTLSLSHLPTAHSIHTAPLVAPDLEQLSRSSTNELRTLSRLAQDGSAEEFALTSAAQEVAGLRGRRRLQRVGKSGGGGGRPGQRTGGYGWEGRNWMDKQRQFLQAYEYLCHIGEAKEWIEDVIHKSIPPIVELEEALRDGVTLAEVVEALNPERRVRIFRNPRLQFWHTDNIAAFFRYLDEIELPDLFRFELVDLYEKKNIPKVIYCIHALSWLLFRKGIVDFRIGNLVGQLEFAHDELEAMQKGLDKLGTNMPSFGTMGADLGVEPEPPTPEPEETEEERIDRELGENEESVTELQAQMRGALERMRLGAVMRGLWDAEDALVELQARIRGDWTRQIIGYRLEMRRFAVSLQSAARGFLARQRQEERESILQSESVGHNVVALQSLFRAQKIRREVQDERSQLRLAEGPARTIQSVFRGFVARQRVETQQRAAHDTVAPTKALQSAVRGMLLRQRIGDDRAALEAETHAITALQAAARAVLARDRTAQQQKALESFVPLWTTFQAACRGHQARAHVRALKAALGEHETEITQLQASIRAAAVRQRIAETRRELQATEGAVVDLQSAIRGMLERVRVSDDLDALSKETDQIIDLQSAVRGFLYRRQHQDFNNELRSHEDEVTSMQSLIRAVLLRGEVATVLERLEEQEEVITAAQAAAKAFVVRAKFEEKRRFFNENMQKVVKIQSFVRAKLQGEAYKSLTTGKNPPVGAVKNFVHLLNDSDFDFNEEVEFERLRKTVVQQVRQNEMLEQYIDQLDIKIALLVKNKITLDEVIRHQNTFGGHTSSLLANSSMASANQFDLKALNKSSRKKLESYQQLFFTLQTQPQYLARLFRRVREQGTAERECRRIEHLMMGLFGYAQKRREEYYLLKLLARAVREEAETCRTLQDHARGNFFWGKLLANYTRSPRDRKFLRDLLGPIIRDNIVEDPALDLESDPLQIYRSAINNEELRTGRPSRRPLDVPRELAIQDPETRELFIDHLRDLREICDQFLLAFEDLLPRMPYGLRFVCRELLESLRQRFFSSSNGGRASHQLGQDPSSSSASSSSPSAASQPPPRALLQLVAAWLWRSYLQPAVTAPENVGVVEKSLGPLQKRNLGEVAKVLGQIAHGRPFGGGDSNNNGNGKGNGNAANSNTNNNMYLQPLNGFIAESSDRLVRIVSELVAVPDAERTFDIDEFNDLYAKNKPTLYIKMSDVFAIHNLVAAELPVLAPAGRDDGLLLREIMQDLGSAKNNESEMMAAAGSSDILMFLTPRLHELELEDPEAAIKALFMETKRCVLYIIRVQTGTNLLEILVKPIGPDDERRWAALLRDDFLSNNNNGNNNSTGTAPTRGAYSDANMVDVTRMSYHELKRTALENVMRLERAGRISKHNRYQDILNAIALDIRTKSRRRVQRQRELEGVRLTLANLHDKAKYLEQQRKSYDDYIEQAMATLQNKKGKKRFLLPFTKQYNHQRELERSGRVPKFGSYKYSARALSDKGVVVSWAGVPDREWGQVNLTISCDEVGVFALEGSRGHIQMPGASALVPIEDLLQAQFEAHQFMTLFEGCLRLNVNLLLHLLYKKFYRTV